MLVLSRKHRETVVVGSGVGSERWIKVTVLEITGGTVKLGFEGDENIPVHRLEVWQRMCDRGEVNVNGVIPTEPDEHIG